MFDYFLWCLIMVDQFRRCLLIFDDVWRCLPIFNVFYFYFLRFSIDVLWFCPVCYRPLSIFDNVWRFWAVLHQICWCLMNCNGFKRCLMIFVKFFRFYIICGDALRGSVQRFPWWLSDLATILKQNRHSHIAHIAHSIYKAHARYARVTNTHFSRECFLGGIYTSSRHPLRPRNGDCELQCIIYIDKPTPFRRVPYWGGPPISMNLFWRGRW